MARLLDYCRLLLIRALTSPSLRAAAARVARKRPAAIRPATAAGGGAGLTMS